MKRIRHGVIGIMLALSISSCKKGLFAPNDQEFNKGSLIWNRALDSFKVQFPGGNAEIYRSKDIVDLQDDGIVFFADGTGRRYQGKHLAPMAPQVENLDFNWEVDPGQTNVFRMWGAGQFDPSRPQNEVTISTDMYHNVLRLSVNPIRPDQPFLIYWYHQIPQ